MLRLITSALVVVFSSHCVSTLSPKQSYSDIQCLSTDECLQSFPMPNKVFRFIAILCSTVCLYVLIAFSSHPRPYQKAFLYEYNKYAKQVFAFGSEDESLTPDDKCCLQESVDTTTQSMTSNDKLYPKNVIQVSTGAQQLIHNSSKQLISTQINQNNTKSVESRQKDCDFNVAMIFTITQNDSKSNQLIDKKLYRSLTSISKHINHKTQTICVNLITDNISESRAKDVLKLIDQKRSSIESKTGLKYYFHDINEVNSLIDDLLPTLKSHFSYKPNSYYSHSLFFTSLAIHRFLTSIDRLIFLDIDVQFNDNISQLYHQFSQFSPTALIGLAFEQQPVYRHILHEYRRRIDNESSFGLPAPDGWPGFNSGVILMDLKRMRESKQYKSLLTRNSMDKYCHKYSFSGHLGDQDFYTVVSFENKHLFHVIPCNWNRQLCQWWRYHGYRDVFEDYYRCNLKIKLFHGNCNSVMPSMPSIPTIPSMY